MLQNKQATKQTKNKQTDSKQTNKNPTKTATGASSEKQKKTK